MEKTKIVLELEKCSDGCPHCRISRTKNAGCAADYHCELKKDDDGNIKMIMGYVEYSGDYKPIPDWCPLRLDPPNETYYDKCIIVLTKIECTTVLEDVIQLFDLKQEKENFYSHKNNIVKLVPITYNHTSAIRNLNGTTQKISHIIISKDFSIRDIAESSIFSVSANYHLYINRDEDNKPKLINLKDNLENYIP